MITDNYIKMCERAKEIQKACKFKKGDWFKIYNLIDDDFSLTVLSGDGNKEYITEYLQGFEHIWLPTQEQLQEMLSNHGHHGYGNSGISTMLSLFSMDYKLEGLTFNELWLCYVMKERWNKIWAGKYWKNE